MASSIESDEAFARRLQAQELGLYRQQQIQVGNSHSGGEAGNNNNPDAQTPLMVSFLIELLFMV